MFLSIIDSLDPVPLVTYICRHHERTGRLRLAWDNQIHDFVDGEEGWFWKLGHLISVLTYGMKRWVIPRRYYYIDLPSSDT